MKTIVLTGGGTAGHVYPALAIWEELQSSFKGHYIGSDGMEKDIVEKIPSLSFHRIDAVKLVRKITFKNIFIPFKLLYAIYQAKKILKEIKPCLIFSKGGFVAVPVVIAGASLGIPIVSHESDLSMGLANKIILKYCKVMCTSFEKTAYTNKKCVYTGQPIRKLVLNGNRNNLPFLNLFDKKKKNLLVVGGSSGARFINEIVWKNIDKITLIYNVIHICGKKATKNVTHSCYKQVDYAENIGDYLAWADFVLSRAGSGAINEFLALKKPMLLIPLSKKCSRGDQIENARLFQNLKIADMIEEEHCDDQMFIIKLKNLLTKEEEYKNNMKKIIKSNPNQKIIEIINQVAIKNGK